MSMFVSVEVQFAIDGVGFPVGKTLFPVDKMDFVTWVYVKGK